MSKFFFLRIISERYSDIGGVQSLGLSQKCADCFNPGYTCLLGVLGHVDDQNELLSFYFQFQLKISTSGAGLLGWGGS